MDGRFNDDKNTKEEKSNPLNLNVGITLKRVYI